MDPITIMMIVGAIASGMTNIFQSISQNKKAGQLNQSTNAAAITDIQLLNKQGLQVSQQADLEAVERQRQGAAERARMLVAMGEAGIEGNTPLREMSNSILQESRDESIIEGNKASVLEQVAVQKLRVGADRQSRLNDAESLKANPYLAAFTTLTSASQGAAAGRTAGTQIWGKR